MFKLLLEFVFYYAYLLVRLYKYRIPYPAHRYPSLSAETLCNLLATLMNALYQPSDDTR